ncbi:NUMOD4 domain-containing protein [Virgibacillus sp. FSP13]
MKEEMKDITGYEGLYKITRSGRIYSIRRQRFLSRCNDEYGFHIVKLSKNGVSENKNVFQLWKKEFAGVAENEFKGALKAIYK